MDTKTSREKGGTVLFVSGEIDAITCDSLREQLVTFLEDDKPKVIVDLANVHYISSAGLRVLLEFAKKMHNYGVFSLSRPREEVKSILEMVGFGTILTIFDDLENAREEIFRREA